MWMYEKLDFNIKKLYFEIMFSGVPNSLQETWDTCYLISKRHEKILISIDNFKKMKYEVYENC